ncbi:MAG: hypothetical protein HY670_12080, partial [Chloroflexi bacterium]|nr:hypothetical protein [Chloroflexota bacterium]
ATPVRLAIFHLNAVQDFAKGSRVSIAGLFSNADLWQQLFLLDGLQADKTRIRVSIDKVSPFETRATVGKRVGEEAFFCMLLNRGDFTRQIAATDNIEKGDRLTIILDKF